MLQSIQRTFPTLALTPADVSFCFIFNQPLFSGQRESYIKLKKIPHGSDLRQHSRVLHDLRQTRHESLMGTFYVDDFDVNRCNYSKAIYLHT